MCWLCCLISQDSALVDYFLAYTDVPSAIYQSEGVYEMDERLCFRYALVG